MIDRDTWWKPFALAMLLVIIGWAPLFFLDLIANNKSDYVGFVMAWGLGPCMLLTLAAIVLVIGGITSLAIQFFRQE